MSFLYALAPIKKLLKTKNVDISNNVFKLYTKLTVTFLLAFCVLVTARELFGKPVDCYITDKSLKDFADSLCWINGTYINRKLKGK